jgi:hypothetical protein
VQAFLLWNVWKQVDAARRLIAEAGHFDRKISSAGCPNLNEYWRRPMSFDFADSDDRDFQAAMERAAVTFQGGGCKYSPAI